MSVDDEQPAFKAQLMTFGESNPSDIAKESYFSANELIERVECGQSLYPELDLRAALQKLLKVFWFFKSGRIEIAKQMHDVGKYLAENYQCAFGFKDGHYFTDCPNMLLHQDYGFSLRGFEKYKCSICDVDPIDCDHRTLKRYNNIQCTSFEGRCNICRGDIEVCDHILGEVYDNVEAIKIVSDLEIITFDLVKEPEFVFSRVLEIPYSRKFITDGLMNDPSVDSFVYGESILDCNHCLTCKGYDPTKNANMFENTYNKAFKADS
ncbi:hypothetical protein CAG69_20720 [Vibrio sp. V43_P6S15P86]|uniref:hypothetical protein n=1 Tax=Vibrio sp. V43_P6S15P86 TaxID=1938694 RepID=UPI0013731A1E|nr:hypothetical protein [Vibrio sp. V43_P6S15P86]NAW84450.1 hypothetical protein [Vibrio sp. V43_P6S15P86]